MLKRLFGLIIIILLSMVVVNAQSQRPSPGPGEKTKPPQKQPATQQQKPESDKRGTEQSPLVVKTVPTPKSQTEAEQEREDHKEKSSQNWWTICLAGIVAAGTFLQAFFLYRTVGETRKAANAAKVSADALQDSERAYLFVKVILTNSEELGENILREGDNHIEIIATNYGKTPAVILNFQRFCQEYANESVIDELVANIDRVAANNPGAITPGTVVIGGGDSRRIFKTTLPLTNEEWRKIGYFDKVKLACLGVIQYKTIFNKIHKTVFCWQYEPFAFFRPDDNPEHNYYT